MHFRDETWRSHLIYAIISVSSISSTDHSEYEWSPPLQSQPFRGSLLVLRTRIHTGVRAWPVPQSPRAWRIDRLHICASHLRKEGTSNRRPSRLGTIPSSTCLDRNRPNP